MPLDEKRFPELIRELYKTIEELSKMFPGRPFTPDGHMVGSLAECFAEYCYGLNLFTPSTAGHDGEVGGSKIEIKATQNDRVAFRSCPEKVLVFLLFKNGSFEEVYNGPGAPVWHCFDGKKKPENGQYQISLTKLKELMKSVPTGERLTKLRDLPKPSTPPL